MRSMHAKMSLQGYRKKIKGLFFKLLGQLRIYTHLAFYLFNFW